nr:unnamed protein product [Spirometra erinaceieuropaei]
MPSTNSGSPPLQSLSSSLSSTASTSAAMASAMPTNTTHNPKTPTNTNTTTADTSGEDMVYTCPNCDRTFTSHIELLVDNNDHARGFTVASGSTLTFWQNFLLKIAAETTEEDAREDLPGDV